MPTGGSIQDVTIEGRTFSVTADGDSNRKLGGYESESQANGDGTTRKVLTRVPWVISDLTVSIDDENEDHEFLQAIADRPDYVPISIAYASGLIYQGTGTVGGELQVSSQATTAGLSLEGTGKLTRQ